MIRKLQNYKEKLKSYWNPNGYLTLLYLKFKLKL